MPIPPAMRLTGRVITGAGELATGAVEVVGDRITFVGGVGEATGASGEATGPPAKAPPGWRAGLTIVPGFVDIHCHGGAGGEFGLTLDDGTTAIRHHRSQGTTSLVASLVSATPQQLLRGMRICAGLTATGELAGVHLEGPFLSTVRCGAQDPAALTDVDLRLVEQLASVAAEADSDAGSSAETHIRPVRPWAQLTYAPERPGAERLPAVLAGFGVLAAIGHTDADARVVRSALTAAAEGAPRGGRPLVTHVFNGMPPLHHRSPGPVSAALASAAQGEAVLEVIADGVHLHPDTVRMLFDTVGPQGICLVTDAMSASGMAAGRYQLGGRQVEVSGRAARLVDGGRLAGGVATMLDLVRICVQHAGIGLGDAVTAATATPADALGLREVGRIEAGRRADLVVLDRDLRLVSVLRQGQWVTS